MYENYYSVLGIIVFLLFSTRILFEIPRFIVKGYWMVVLPILMSISIPLICIISSFDIKLWIVILFSGFFIIIAISARFLLTCPECGKPLKWGLSTITYINPLSTVQVSSRSYERIVCKFCGYYIDGSRSSSIHSTLEKDKQLSNKLLEWRTANDIGFILLEEIGYQRNFVQWWLNSKHTYTNSKVPEVYQERENILNEYLIKEGFPSTDNIDEWMPVLEKLKKQ